MEQVEDNLKMSAQFKPLSDKEQEVIAEVKAIVKSRVKKGCRYCMPCPAGVDIPGCFAYYTYQNYNIVRGAGKKELPKLIRRRIV